MSKTVALITTIVMAVKPVKGTFTFRKNLVADSYLVVGYPIETSKWQGNSLVSNSLGCANCSIIGH